jgi:hypothetical protein
MLLIVLSLADFAGDIAYLISAVFYSRSLFILSIIFVFGHLIYSIVFEVIEFERYEKTSITYQRLFKIAVRNENWKSPKGIFEHSDSLAKAILNLVYRLLYFTYVLSWSILSFTLTSIFLLRIPNIILSIVLVPTKMIGIRKVKRKRDQILEFCGFKPKTISQADNTAENTRAIDSQTLGRLVLLEQITESIPQFIIQIVNSLSLGTLPNVFGWIKLIFSAYLAISGTYSFFYYRIYLKKSWEEIPLGFLVQLMERANRRSSTIVPTEIAVSEVATPSSVVAPSKE